VRILVITNMYPPHYYGGYELSCADAVRGFRRRGHRVSVLTSTIRVDGAAEDTDDEVCRELEIYWREHAILSPSVLERLRMERRNQGALRRAIASARPDVVSVWNMGAVSLGLLTTLRRVGGPVVFVLCDDWPAYAPGLDAWSRLFQGRRRAWAGRALTALTGLPSVTSDWSDLGPCLFISRAMMAAVESSGVWAMPRRAVVYNGINPGYFPIAPETAPVESRPWRQRMLYVGRIDERKGIDTILRALPSLPGARLRVDGRGDQRYQAELRSLAADLGVADRVSWVVQERQALRREYAAADVLVFPSVYDEPFGLVPLEAMACDTPVVATGAGGSGEYLVDGWNSLLYPRGDPAGLAAAVRRLAEDPLLRERLVRHGRRTARALTTEEWMDSLTAWHEYAAGGFGGAPPSDRVLELGSGPSGG
jgi:glycogen(starch) synthase